MLLMLAIGCKKENNHSDTPVEPEPPTDGADTVYYNGLITNSIYADCLTGSLTFDTAYPAVMMVEYPDSGSIHFHFSFADYQISYNTGETKPYEAVRTAKFEQKDDSTYIIGDTRTPPGYATYKLRGDSLLITETAKESKWYNRYTTFSGKKR